MLSLCYDSGKRGMCSGSVLDASLGRFHYGSLPRWLATVAATPVYPVAGKYASSSAYREGEGWCALPRLSLHAEGGCASVLRPSWIGEWGCTTERWGRSVAMWKLIGMNYSRPERAGR